MLFSRIHLFAYLLSLFSVGCAGSNGLEPWRIEGLAKVSAMESRWKAQMSTQAGYDLSYTEHCFCALQTYKVSVSQGTISTASYEILDYTTSPPQARSHAVEDMKSVVTVEQYFAYLRRAYETADEVELNFESVSDIVPSVSIDWDAHAFDDEIGYTIESLSLKAL